MAKNISKKEKNKLADPIDVHVGEQLQMQRRVMGLSQTALGKAAGVSFQQIQKYEGAYNRICASRLFKLAQVLKVDISYFFKGIGTDFESSTSVEGGFRESNQQLLLDNVINSRLGLELNRAFVQLKDPKKAKLAVDLVKQFVADEANTDD